MTWDHLKRLAAGDFSRAIWPVISRQFPSGNLVSVELEAQDAASADTLDRLAGVDWLLEDGDGVTTIASRVQYGTLARWSFTFGVAEWHKRRRSLRDSRVLAPIWTVHGYVERPETGRLLSACVIPTRDLFTFIERFPGCVRWHSNTRTGQPFGVVWADCLDDEGFEPTLWLSDPMLPVAVRDGISDRDSVRPWSMPGACNHHA
jgi:hypothetical protein